jgi:hypothetical protein
MTGFAERIERFATERLQACARDILVPPIGQPGHYMQLGGRVSNDLIDAVLENELSVFGTIECG